MPRYELKTQQLQRFWEIRLEGQTHVLRMGDIGTDGRQRTKSFRDPQQAAARFREAIQMMEDAGYVEVLPEIQATEQPEGPLVERIYADPDDIEARLVHGDWLQARNDPHGELVALQARVLEDPEAEARLRPTIDALTEQLCPLGDTDGVYLDWHLGFIRRARLEVPDLAVDALVQLLATRAADFLQRLEVTVSATHAVALSHALVASGARPTLGELHVTSPHFNQNHLRAHQLFRLYPNLHTLEVSGLSVDFAEARMTSLKVLRVRATRDLADALRTGAPQLTTLEVLAHGRWGGIADAFTVANLPSLERLILHLGDPDLAFEVLAAAATNGLVDQLRSVDVSGRTLDADHPLRALPDRYSDAFARVRLKLPGEPRRRIQTQRRPRGLQVLRFETRERYWEISRDGAELWLRYGPFGSRGTVRRMSHDNASNARIEMERRIEEKRREGYEPLFQDEGSPL